MSSKKQYCCLQCDNSYSAKASLNRHNREKHNAKSTSRYQSLLGYRCSHCGKVLTTNNRLKIHINNMHTQPAPKKELKKKPVVKNIKCAYCEEMFQYWSKLTTHVKTRHTPNRKMMCDHCGVNYLTKSRLVMHLKSHHQK
jgi:hypothetical protein